MPCGVETTKRIAELMKTENRPISIIEISDKLKITRSAARDGINNMLDSGFPLLLMTERRIPGRQGRPERAYTLLQTD